MALLAGAGVAALATSGSSPAASADSSSSQASPSQASPNQASPNQASPAPSATPRGPAAQPPGQGGGFFGGAIGGGFSGAPVHGTLVVPASGGAYQTEDIQRGKVTAISGSSLTVVSPDGYTKTYQVSGSTSVIPGNGSLSTVKVGDQVSLTATARGSTAAVTSIVDLSRLGNGYAGPGGAGPGGAGQGQPSG